MIPQSGELPFRIYLIHDYGLGGFTVECHSDCFEVVKSRVPSPPQIVN